MKILKKKYINARIIFMAFVISFIVSACENYYEAINSISANLSSYNVSPAISILENDTIHLDTILLRIVHETESLQLRGPCVKIFSNPIGALMGLSIDTEWCHEEQSILITSDYDYNGVSAGESINHFFYGHSDAEVEDAIDVFYGRSIQDSGNTQILALVNNTKPTNPLQKFNITIATDKGTYTTETVPFYWE